MYTYFAAVSGMLQILSYFHKHKKQRGVDAMLLKLYDPILWRSLKVNAFNYCGRFSF